MAKLGFGMLMVMQNEWPKAAEDIAPLPRDRRPQAGHTPRPPIILTNVCCAESRAEAHDRAMRYLGQKWESIDDHYHFSDGHLSTVKGYESYGKMARTYAKMNESAESKAEGDRFLRQHPDRRHARRLPAEDRRTAALTGMDHLVTEFSFGAMPHEEAECNMRLFADRVLPTLQRDTAFAAPKLPELSPVKTPAGERLFAPA